MMWNPLKYGKPAKIHFIWPAVKDATAIVFMDSQETGGIYLLYWNISKTQSISL